MTSFMEDPELSWGAVGIMAYLVQNGMRTLDEADLVGLAPRSAGVWHPSDRGDFERGWDELLSIGYVEAQDAGGWAVYPTRPDEA